MWWLWSVVLCMAGEATASALFTALNSSIFLNRGVVLSSDRFVSVSIPVTYNEPDAVACARCSWSVGGSMPYLYKDNDPTPWPSCNISSRREGVDLPGNDLEQYQLPTNNITLCEQRCCQQTGCAAYVYEPMTDVKFGECVPGKPCCFLKSAPGTAVPKSIPGGVYCGTIASNRSAPPVGMRSAVPLGGLGAGSLELRADGSLHEWTIVNQSPAGAAKFPLVADAFTALHVSTPTDAPTLSAATESWSRMLRTHPPAWAGPLAAAESLVYGGSYPMSRLQLDAGPSAPISAALYAYSTLVPGSPEASMAPAVVFTLAVTNTQAKPANVSFMFAAPLAAVNDCVRPSPHPLTVLLRTAGAADCLHACDQSQACGSWTFYGENSSCVLASDVPLSFFHGNTSCGVRGTWQVDSPGSLTLSLQPSLQAPNPAVGNMTISALNSGSSITSAGYDDDISALWLQFQKTGSLISGPKQGVAQSGAVSVTTIVPAGESTTLSIVFAWYFPDRDHVGETIGNAYANVWSSAGDVAASLGNDTTLVAVVENINKHHSILAGQGVSYPQWLQDAAINYMSHFHMLIWRRDGGMREFEAFSCDDLDDVHNDYQRHLIYLWALPEYERQKLTLWAQGQAADGHVWEWLGAGCGSPPGPMDQPGGRIMGDTTSLVLLELYELWANTGDLSLARTLWPHLARAVAWEAGNAARSGLPAYLTCTYDHFSFERYDALAFNAFIHLAAMQAAMRMAEAVGDTGTLAIATSAFTNATEALVPWLWNGTAGYFRAFTNGPAGPAFNSLFADTLYGQMLSLHVFGDDAWAGAMVGRDDGDHVNGAGWAGTGWQTDPDKIAQHLLAEETYNFDNAGLRVITNPVTEASVWLGGAMTWSYLQVRLRRTTTDYALSAAMRTVTTVRDRLADPWNLRALLQTDDANPNDPSLPREQGHYAFALPLYYLLPGLSGQLTELHRGRLTFAPHYACPFQLPWFLVGASGTLSCQLLPASPSPSTNVAMAPSYTFTMVFGTALVLPAYGLAVAGLAYPLALALGPGQSVSWS